MMSLWPGMVYSSLDIQASPSLIEVQEYTYQLTEIDTLPSLEREFRGAWMATVHNIDWPSKPGLSVHEQKKELTQILDLMKQIKLNALILQVRPACDAFYSSEFEPWSYYLTGKMGKAPEPFYDPLAFAVEEAHKRGLELHAWFNPFRALTSVKTKGRYVYRSHISKKRPDLVKRYGNYLWLDPTRGEAKDYTIQVIMDVVKRYDIDGVHMDDYFYPYPLWKSRKKVDFPDYSRWKAYRDQGGELGRTAWRRSKVNHFVSTLYRSIKAEKPWVKFGVSPFGIWRPNYPEGIKTGIDSYEDLCADSRLWLRQGWVDYMSPQLYWPISSEGQPFLPLLDWWSQENINNRHLWPGISSSFIGPKRPASESLAQIDLIRERKDQAKLYSSGHIQWSITSMIKNKRGLTDLLQSESFTEDVLPPAFPWLSSELPKQPLLDIKPIEDGLKIEWNISEDSPPVWKWICQWNDGEEWHSEVLSSEQRNYVIPLEDPTSQDNIISLRGLDRAGNEGSPAILAMLPVPQVHPRIEEGEEIEQSPPSAQKPFWHFFRSLILGSH